MPYEGEHFFKSLATAWLEKIQVSARAREPWAEVARQCDSFFSGPCGFMWEDKYRKQYMKDTKPPKFQITINKAFEMVALFAPILVNRHPYRSIKPWKPLELPPELYGDVQNDPNAQKMYQESQSRQTSAKAINAVRCDLFDRWLNYTPVEQPDGGLKGHSYLAVQDALVKGRGCLWIEPYQQPGSDRWLTGCFHDTPENLYIDPDARKWQDVTWMARRHVTPHWKLEKKFNLKKNSLKGKASLESGNAQGENQTDQLQKMHRQEGKTFDLVVWYEVWSTGGAGGRMTEMLPGISQMLDDTVGDYAYLAVCQGCEYPLNAPEDKVRDASPEEVAEMFAWPVPYWTDGKWPVAVIDFYPKSGSIWPIPPMAPGLGELMFLNVMMSHLCNRIWSSSRDFWVVDKALSPDAKAAIKEGADQCIMEIDNASGGAKGIENAVKMLTQAETRMDVWRIMEEVSQNFDKRVGLSDMLYAMNPGGQQMRSAQEASNKQSAANVRPDDMADKVADWQSDAARKEKLCATLFIKAADVAPLVGEDGAQAWQALVENVDVETVLREMDATVSVSDVRKPNKDRDTANVTQALQTFLPEFGQHANSTGDTNPLNSLVKMWGEATGQDVSAMQMGQRMPPPPPEGTPDPNQIEMQKLDMELKLKQADMEMKQFELQSKQAESAIELQSRQAEALIDLELRQQELEFAKAEHAQGIKQDKEKAKVDMSIKKKQAAQKPKAGAKA